MNHTAIAAAADRIARAWETHTPCDPVRDLLPETDLSSAYAIQDHNTRRWEAAGRRICGRKIGLTSVAIQTQLGVDQPDYGMLWADTCFTDAEPVPLSRILQPRAEGEIAFVLDRDLDREGLVITDVISAISRH